MALLFWLVLMARLLSCGFELNSIAMESHISENSPPISSAVKRSGSYALRANGWTTGTKQRTQFRFINTAALGPYCSRGYLRIDTYPSAENRILRLEGSSVSPYVTLGSTGILKLYDEDGLIGTAASALPNDASTWSRVEVEMDASGVAGSHVCNLYVDGVQVAGATNRSIANTVHSLSVGGNLNGESQTQGDWYWDDLAINDSTAGGTQTGLPGSGKIVHLYIDGDGDMGNAGSQATDWDTGPSTGGTAYQQIDETPTPNDATDYVQLIVASSGATNRVLYFTLQPSSTPGIGASDAVTLVQEGIRVSCLTAANATYVLGLQSQPAGTKLESAGVVIGVTAWNTHDDSAGVQQYKLTSYVDPQAGGAWTPALLDTAQVGVRATDATPDMLVTSLWLLAEYVPGAAGRLPVPVIVRQAVNLAGTY